jgi:hypothetical protein
MIELTGDFFEIASRQQFVNVMVCTINLQVKKDGRLVMGAGIAKQFRDRFIDLDLRWGYQRNNKWPHLLFDWQKGVTLVGLPTKDDWRDKSDIDFVKFSLERLFQFVEYDRSEVVMMTRPGCGHGGLKWEDVKPIMTSIGYDDRFIVVHKE